MNLENEKVNYRRNYRVGYSPDYKKYLISIIVVLNYNAWFSRYYEISKEEYDDFGSIELDKLAEQLSREGVSSDRFIYSDLIKENKV